MWKSTELILRVDWIFITLEPLNLASALYTAVIQHVTLPYDLQASLGIGPDNGFYSWGLNITGTHKVIQ